MPPRLSIILITRNEEIDLPDCLQSVQPLGGEIIVVDNQSQDRTRAIAREYTEHVYVRTFDDYASQKQSALDRATGDWVLSLDADERVSPSLREEISELISADDGVAGYTIPFEVHFMGRRLRFGGPGCESHLRLFKRTAGKFVGGQLHESISVQGRTGRCRGRILHIPYRNLDDYLDKLGAYTTNAARKRMDAGRRFSPLHHLLPVWEFFVRTILRLGILDGSAGIVWAGLSSFHTWIKFLKLRELERRS